MTFYLEMYRHFKNRTKSQQSPVKPKQKNIQEEHFLNVEVGDNCIQKFFKHAFTQWHAKNDSKNSHV